MNTRIINPTNPYGTFDVVLWFGLFLWACQETTGPKSIAGTITWIMCISGTVAAINRHYIFSGFWFFDAVGAMLGSILISTILSEPFGVEPAIGFISFQVGFIALWNPAKHEKINNFFAFTLLPIAKDIVEWLYWSVIFVGTLIVGTLCICFVTSLLPIPWIYEAIANVVLFLWLYGTILWVESELMKKLSS
jgi:hypothetical protein